MKKGLLATAAALAVMGTALEANALALGAVTVRSALGEPLRAEIEVPQISSEEASTLQASMGSLQAFQAAGVEYNPALAGARVTLQRRANGQAYLRVTGERPINEPFLGIVIEANWEGGRIVRDYTMLVDPPSRAAPPPVTATQPPSDAQPTTPVAVQTTPGAQGRQARAPRADGAGRTARRAAAPAPMAGEGPQVTVQRGDTAYAIASAHAVDGVSLDQMLVAMLRANPRAFINGNVNLMRAGAVLNMPTAEQAAAVSRQSARRTVVAQTRDFNAYRRGLATRTQSTRLASASRSASGGIQSQVQESRPAAPSQDKLTVSRGGSPTGAESQVAQSRQAQEQAERVAELNRNLQDLASLQGASSPAVNAPAPGINVPTGAMPEPVAPAQTPGASSAPAETPMPAPVNEAMPGMSPASSADPALVASEPASAASPSEAGASEPVIAAPEPAPAPVAPPPPPAPAPAPAPEPSFLQGLMAEPMLPIAGAGLLALLLGYGVFRSRQRKKAAAPLDSSFIESRLQPDSFFGSSGGQRVNTKDGGGSVGNSSMAYSPSQLDAAGDVDPVAEADVYLAYGRDMQAEEILKEALRTQPARASIYRKLAEIYAKRRDARALELIATDAYSVTHGEGPDWLAITSLGSELEPDNQLYKPGGVPVVRTASMPARHSFGADTEPQTAQVLDKDDGPASSNGPSSLGLDLDLDLDDAPVRAAPAPAPKAPAAPVSPVTAAAAVPVVAAAPLDNNAPLDFDLDLSTPDNEPSAPAAKVPATAPSPIASSDAGMIDFDMDALSLDPDSRSGGELKTEQPEDADEDPLGTKLSLAQEFHAIGDTEGARALVKEVIAESSGALRARAERFLAELE
ncbi:MAG: FimV/HubP family polar landmark protein [Pseudomonadota bacterium]|nr:FimV/HubP family polar landmark protein [Pseudomonadota bacterium]